MDKRTHRIGEMDLLRLHKLIVHLPTEGDG
jgi:hypothetical protein